MQKVGEMRQYLKKQIKNDYMNSLNELKKLSKPQLRELIPENIEPKEVEHAKPKPKEVEHAKPKPKPKTKGKRVYRVSIVNGGEIEI